jgi:putative component of toxin-antitoxin plasmid stabilization module
MEIEVSTEYDKWINKLKDSQQRDFKRAKKILKDWR